MKLVIGLGNPTPRYEKTRHNVGFRVVDKLSEVSGIGLHSRKHFSLFGRGEFAGDKVILAKPLTYVNESGKAVRSFIKYYRIGLEDFLLIYDDMDLELGRLRIRPGGSSGGHKGVESIIHDVGCDEFARIRIGIGRKASQSLTDRDFVLEKLSGAERVVIEEAVLRSVKAVETIFREGLSAAMNRFN